jgi:2-amino-4-hydroxy-6-hydroxymethyldihydropteridine diphosphokinase
VNKIFLHLGTNEEDRLTNLNAGISEIGVNIGKIIRTSKIYETEPWGLKNQNMFLNIVVEVDTLLSPEKLLGEIKKTELQIGRVKVEKWGPRKIDIDILCYNDLIINTNELTIPHPQIENRNFVLIPLMELEPDLILPGYTNSVEELYELSRDTCEVFIFESK